MTYPTLRAAFSRELPMPSTGYAGVMAQPHWVSTGDQGNGFFITGDESVLCAIDREGQIFWQTTARVAFAGYALDQRSIYAIDGYVLLRFDIGLIQKKLTAPVTEMLGDVERDPQRAFNLITLETSGVEENDSPVGDIYKLTDKDDIANAGKLTKSRQRRAWLRVLQEAKAEWLKNGERLHSTNDARIPSDYYDLLASRERQLAGFMDDARWLLGVDELNRDRSCRQLITRIEAEIAQLEVDAAGLRFSAPVVRRNWDFKDIAVFTMSGTGLFMGFSSGFKETMGSKQNPPRAMQVSIEEETEHRTTLAYLSDGGITSLLIDSNGLTVLSTTPTQMNSRQWSEQLAQRHRQFPWKQASLPGTSTEFAVHRLEGNGARGILVVSKDERNDEEIIQLISYPGTVPDTPPTPDFTQEAPAIIGGRITNPSSDACLPFIVPISVRNENDSTFIYALSFSSFAPSPLLSAIDNTRSAATAWGTFIGADATVRGQKRASVMSGTLTPPAAIMRLVYFNKIKLQGNVTNENWMGAWQDANDAFKLLSAEKAKLNQLQQEAKDLHAYLDDIFAKAGIPAAAEAVYDTWQALKDAPGLDWPDVDNEILKIKTELAKINIEVKQDLLKYIVYLPRTIMRQEAAVASAEANFASKSMAAASVVSSSPLWTVWRTAS